MLSEKLSRIKEKSIAEGMKLFWIFIYLWVLLGLFTVHRSIVLSEPDLIYHQGFALINAWLLAKVMLTAEMFHVADNLKDRPLIYPIVFKSGVYSIILLCFYFLEETFLGMWQGKTFAESLPSIGGGTLNGTLVVGVIMFFVLMPFFALRELGRDIGENNLYEQFFVRRSQVRTPAALIFENGRVSGEPTSRSTLPILRTRSSPLPRSSSASTARCTRSSTMPASRPKATAAAG